MAHPIPKLKCFESRLWSLAFAQSTEARCLVENEDVVGAVPINNIPALVLIMARRRIGDKPLSEPMMVSLLMHICATRPQWVKDCCHLRSIFITLIIRVFQHTEEIQIFLNINGTWWRHDSTKLTSNGPLARYVKLQFAHAPGMLGTPPRVSDPDMHHGTCVTHIPWCMSGSFTSGFLWNRWRGKTFQAFPAHAQPAILRIWQEAHGHMLLYVLGRNSYEISTVQCVKKSCLSPESVLPQLQYYLCRPCLPRESLHLCHKQPSRQAGFSGK